MRRGGSPPVHLRPAALALVWVGGACGTLARYGLALAMPRLGTLAANLVGSFLLGLLVEGLARRGADRGRRRAVRLLLGTGLLGGFTTYSTVAVETVQHLRADQVGLAAGYALGSVLLGTAAAVLGIVLAGRAVPRHGAL